jgi:hypothetical protein|tara:strand:+ start:22869 stop:23339 length:471 start_codon:yes stop_codon:yes gene_type:complete
MDREELLKLNETIDTFLEEYSYCFKDVISNLTVEEYLDFFYELHEPIKAVQFKSHYTYTGEILRQYADRIVLTYQPSELKNGFLGVMVQLSPKVHMIAQIGAEFRDDDMSTVGVTPIFVSFDGMSPALDWAKDNSDHIHQQVYQNENPNKSSGFGF